MRLALIALLLLLPGCGALGAPTDQAPGWVQVLDRLNGVIAKVDAQSGRTVVTQTAPDNPLGNTGPIGGVAVSALALAWFFIRRQAAAHENAVSLLGASVPAALHQASVDALAVSRPVSATSTVPTA